MSPLGEHAEGNKPGDPTNADSRGQTSLERLLDIGVYAPLGLLANKSDVVRDLAAEGRKQVAFSRSLGRAALKAVAAGSRSTKTHKTPRTHKAPRTDKTPSPAIAGYESLTAREIVALIPSCSAKEQEWIEATERTGKGRVTILRALQSDRSN